MVDTDKDVVKESEAKGLKDIIKAVAETVVLNMLAILLLSAVFKFSISDNAVVIYTMIIVLAILSYTIISIMNKSGIFNTGRRYARTISIIIPVLMIVWLSTTNSFKEIAEPKVVENNQQTIDLINYDSRFDIILPNDVIKQNGLTLYDTLLMSEKLREAYPNDGFDLVLYDSYQQDGELFEVTVKSNLDQKYVITMNTATKVVDSNITKSDNTKTLTEMGEPIYSFSPEQKATFETYVTEAGYNNDTSLCSIDELKCCWYIYFTDGGVDCYIKVARETNSVTEKGTVIKGERVKAEEVTAD